MSTEWRIYGRSVLFVLITAVQELYYGAEVVVQFTANKGLFCEVNYLPVQLDAQVVSAIEARMRQMRMTMRGSARLCNSHSFRDIIAIPRNIARLILPTLMIRSISSSLSAFTLLPVSSL